jgi:hypothetical protein
MERIDKPEQLIAQWGYQLLFEDSLEAADPQQVRHTCNKVAEVNALIFSYLREKGKVPAHDQARLLALKAWAKGEPTPAAYASLFRQPKK